MHDSQVIPAEAVEAAMSALYPNKPGEFARDVWETTIHTILEAAAPYLIFTPPIPEPAEYVRAKQAEAWRAGFWKGTEWVGSAGEDGSEDARFNNPHDESTP